MVEFNGRNADGRFGEGNSFAKGNPHAAKVNRLRSAMLSAVTDDDLRAIVVKLIELAKGGDVMAAREVLDRTLGKPSPSDVLVRVERLESLLEMQEIRIDGHAE